MSQSDQRLDYLERLFREILRKLAEIEQKLAAIESLSKQVGS